MIIPIKERQKDIFGNLAEEQDQLQALLDSIQVKDSSMPLQLLLTKYFPYVKANYSQDWSAYDKAKTNQDILFKKMLQELLFLTLQEDTIPKRGRKAYSKKDRLFAMCIKVFYKSDLRKCQSILKELKNLHYIEKVPCFKSIDNFFNDAEISKILDELIFISALPLSNVEQTGAIDSTGFSTSRFENWNSVKWGKDEGKARIWRKAHAAIGCKTNIFFSVEITRRNVADASMFEKVIGNKPKFFNMENFVADKAYLSRNILNFINELGLNPYIPFKSNSRALAKGCPIWRTLFYEFKTNRESYMQKYHQRSNIETGFHMVKQRFGDHLMTKNLTANVNEIKVKFLCHNICVLIQEAFERSISIDFDACVNKIRLCNN